MNRWKYRSNWLLKAIFCHQKVIKKQIDSAWNFLQTSNTSVQSCLYLLTQNQCPHFLLSPPLFKEYLNPQVRINKMANKHTADYHPSPSQLTSRIQPLIFLWVPKGFISLEFFFSFFLSLSIPPWLRKSFKYMVLRLLVTTFVSQKLNLLIFTYAPKQREITPPRQKEITHSSQTVFSEDLFFHCRKGGGELWSLKNYKN